MSKVPALGRADSVTKSISYVILDRVPIATTPIKITLKVFGASETLKAAAFNQLFDRTIRKCFPVYYISCGTTFFLSNFCVCDGPFVLDTNSIEFSVIEEEGL